MSNQVDVHVVLVHGEEAVINIGELPVTSGEFPVLTRTPDEVRVPVAQVADETGIPVSDLPGRKLVATRSESGELSAFRLAGTQIENSREEKDQMADDHSDSGDGYIALVYRTTRRVLARFPIPIMLPDLQPVLDTETSEGMLLAMAAAYRIIGDAPEPPVLFGIRMKDVIREWLAAYEMGAYMTMAGASPWRMDAAVSAIRRARQLSRVARTLLELEEDEDDSPSDG